MTRKILFAGTTEGRLLCEYAIKHKVSLTVCVATEYGEVVLPEGDCLQILVGRKTKDEIIALIAETKADVVIDATHPYAVNVTENIKSACNSQKVAYERVIRERLVDETEEDTIQENVLFFNSIQDVVCYLNQVEGNALITTGSKELAPYLALNNWKQRLIFRMLPTVEAMTSCEALGIASKQVIAMQGPFSEAMNTLMLQEKQASYLVTKESGGIGGFLEKCNAAKKAGATILVIRRPSSEQGKTVEEMKQVIESR